MIGVTSKAMPQNYLIARRTLLRSAMIAPLFGSLPAFGGGKDFWETKPSTGWNADEIDRMLTKSPWAKDASGSFNGGPGGYGGNRGGGRRSGGIGFPGGGGGIGFPGGGGGGYPGGGRTGGGGSPGGGGGYPGGGDGRQNYHATVRWESALPIQQALQLPPEDGKPDPEFAKYYVIQVLGDLPDFGAPRRRRNDDDSGDSSTKRRSRDDDDEDAQNERRLEMFKQYTKIELHDRSLRLEKVEQGSRTSSRGPGTLFYFSRMDDVSLDDKLLTFVTKMGPVEIKAKFVPKEMVYHGKLAV